MNKLWSVLFLILFASVAPLHAGISVDPTVTEISVAQGTTYEGEYTVINTGEEALELTVETVNWLERYLQKENLPSVDKWLTIKEPEFILQPGEVKKVPFTVHIDHSIRDEQVAQVFFGFRPADENVQMFRTRLGVILYVGVEGEERPEVVVDKLVVSSVQNEDGTVSVHAKINLTNRGNVHARPAGMMRLIAQQEVVQYAEIKPGKGIYAGTSDSIEGAIQNCTLKPGSYKCEVELEGGMYNTSYPVKAAEFVTVN